MYRSIETEIRAFNNFRKCYSKTIIYQKIIEKQHCTMYSYVLYSTYYDGFEHSKKYIIIIKKGNS